MSSPVTIIAQAAVSQGTLEAAAAQPGSPQDLERLRELVSGVSSRMEAVPSPGVGDIGGVSEAVLRSPGDAILDGISRMKQGYEQSLESIENRLGALADGDPMAIGNDFADTVALQLDVARWSMSVMGIDNSSKAGTNTIKELSKGG